VVPVILVTPECQVEVVPLVFRYAQATGVLRVSTPSEAAHEQVVEQDALVIQRAHAQGLVEDAWSLLLIDESVVRGFAGLGINKAITEFERALVVIIAVIHALRRCA